MADIQKYTHSTPAKKTVTLAVTPEQLSTAHTWCEAVTIQSLRANTGLVCVGDANVSITDDRGIILSALNTITLNKIYLDEIYIDVETNGEGVSYYVQAQRSVTAP